MPDPTAAPVTVPVAWLGRTSTEDNQDPTLSLPRQLQNARKALPPGWVIVAHFYDIESGRKDLDARGRSLAHTRFAIPIPRDGGIADLLEEVERPDRRFAAVICESIERVARRTYFGTKIEYQLEQAGVALCAADEPIVTGRRAKRATPTLTRRVKQAVAEWYVLQMLELSWDGAVEHTRQGWNTGKPPYGYRAEKVPHPVPARRAEGRTKHRLVPDPERAPAVTRIFQFRVFDRLGYDTIADRLNPHLDRYPPPQATRAHATLGRWSGSAVREILNNPKYTGYQVWNRRAMKEGGRNNDPKDWVWSPRPVHEPLVTRELFDQATSMTTRRRGSRAEGSNRHPRTCRSYVLRSYVRCDLCDRRMQGKPRHGVSYYACQPNNHHHRDHEWYQTHPRGLWIREETLLTAVSDFFSTRIFGPNRRAHLAAALTASASGRQEEERDQERAALERSIAELERRQARLIHSLAEGIGTHSMESDDPDAERSFREAIRAEHATLDRQRQALRRQLTDLGQQPATDHQPGDPVLLDALPTLDLRLESAPETVQRTVYEAFGLQLRYSRPREELGIRVVVTRDTKDRLTDAVREVREPGERASASASQERDSRAGEHRSKECSLVPCTPDGIRTRATALKGRRPGPLDDGGWASRLGTLGVRLGAHAA
jgi:site-specific DNA recombinase